MHTNGHSRAEDGRHVCSGVSFQSAFPLGHVLTQSQGGMGKPDINFPIMAMCTKELRVHGSFRYGPGDYQTAVDLVATKRISVKELITGKVKFYDAESAFKDVKEGKGIKVLIEGPEE